MPSRFSCSMICTHDPAIGMRAKRHLSLRDGKIVADDRHEP